MVQFRKSHPARCRRIKRDKSGVDRKGIAGLKVRSKIHDKNKEEEDTTDTSKTLQEHLQSDKSDAPESLHNNRPTRSRCSQSSNSIDKLTDDFDRTL